MKSEELYLADVWRVLMRSKYIIIFLTLLAAGFSVYYGATRTKVFRAEALLSVVEEKSNSGVLSALGQFGNVASFAGLNTGGGGKRDEYLAVLSSRKFGYEFIEEFNLLKVFYAPLWNEATKSWEVETVEEEPTIQDAWNHFNHNIRFVRVDNDTGMIQLSIEWSDPEAAALWVNSMVDKANKILRDKAITEAQESLVFLNGELQKTSVVGLRQGLFRLIELKTQDEMMANVSSEYAFKVIDPAIAPDADRFIRPKPVFIAIIGTLMGFFAGVFIAFFRGYVLAPARSKEPVAE